MLARARLHKSLADGLDRRLKVSRRRTIVAEVRSGAAYYQPPRSASVFCTTMERPGDPGRPPLCTRFTISDPAKLRPVRRMAGADREEKQKKKKKIVSPLSSITPAT
ncbi:hypothetical protein K0M31_007822 [Melipona bicolor]|uniref:Uncharacterized protein n=1 Tax=Melipona bicolor TaxID=60889 RepID=A0AA40GCY3_9HYME|nr:hypothetical protein K0M31_007822 [Melipona bicolor]